MHTFRLFAALAAALMLSACGKEAPAPAAAPALAPAPAALQPIFDRSCKTCHANPASGAPLAGDTATWAPRVTQGRATLLDHTINGFKGMPPMGMCMDCSEEQFVGLIEYMAGTKLH